MYAGVQFDWDSLTSVFWSPSASGVKFPTPSPQEPGARNIYCPEAAHLLLVMAHIMVNEVSTPLSRHSGSVFGAMDTAFEENKKYLHGSVVCLHKFCPGLWSMLNGALRLASNFTFFNAYFRAKK